MGPLNTKLTGLNQFQALRVIHSCVLLHDLPTTRLITSSIFSCSTFTGIKQISYESTGYLLRGCVSCGRVSYGCVVWLCVMRLCVVWLCVASLSTSEAGNTGGSVFLNYNKSYPKITNP